MAKKTIPDDKIEELANLFMAKTVTIYELEKMTGIPSKKILNIFRKDLYRVNFDIAKRVNRVLDSSGNFITRKYFKEVVG